MTSDAGRGQRVVIVAPTAAGKSDVAMDVAVRVAGSEIVAVDSMQVYAGMDVGTAKPSPADRRRVTHHGLDLVVPTERFTVADYVATVGPIVRDASAPLVLVAGTGLYLTAVIDGLELPGEWPDVRATLERRAADDLDDLYAELRAADHVAAARIERGNRRRIVRALEVCIGSGRLFSSFGPGVTRYPASAPMMIGLRWTREALAGRISARVVAMREAGLVDEVAELLDRHGSLSPTASQALGYKEVIAHLRGDTNLDEAFDRIVTRTRQFAVRQERWYRRDPRIRWVDVSADPVEAAAPSVIEALTTT